MKRTICGACGHADLQQILDLGMSPIADAYTETHDEIVPMYPLQLAVCTKCYLVQLLEVLPQHELFGTGYSFYSSASAPLSDYHEQYANAVIDAHTLDYNHTVVEIGCNDGDMLRHFHSAGCLTIGVDPSGGPAQTALERGLSIINEPFNTHIAQRITSDYGHADIVIANHVLAHVESVAEVLQGIAKLLAPNGTAYIEVQYLPDLIVNNAFDLVYHEHRNFFSLTTLVSAARRWGLHVYNAVRTDRQGGSLRVMLKRTVNQPSSSVEHLLAAECWLSTVNAYGGLQGRVDHLRDRLIGTVSSFQHVIGYGAPAKATTLLHLCKFTSNTISYVIDTTEAKQHKYIPGTGIPIIPPTALCSNRTDKAATVILAWNYAQHIMRANSTYGGTWILPIPSPILL